MTLEDLYIQTVPTFTPSTQKDLKTAVKALAQALGYGEPKSCPLEVCVQPLPTLYRQIETFLLGQAKGPHTQRNVKNNVSRLLRQAERQGLITLAPRPLNPHFNPQHRPRRPGTEFMRKDGSLLRYQHWPPSLKAAFDAFATWATDPFVEGRQAHFHKRPSTVNIYQKSFSSYFGFLYHTCHIHEPTFNHLFDISLIRKYIHWHINEKHHRVTVTVHLFMNTLCALIHQYRPQPHLYTQLQALRRTLPTPIPTLNKSDAWVPLRELHDIGEILWPRQPPPPIREGHTGSLAASHAGFSLMLQLWTHIPYRQRNIREMTLHTNLRNDHGTWHIRFNGDQLKIGQRQGQPSVLDFPFPPALIPRLEAYLSVWRPILARGANPPPTQVFLNRRGHPFTHTLLRDNTQDIVYRYTGKHWHPHIIRTVWATEYIRTTGDFYGAAIMLNDSLKTVIKTYAHLREENTADKAYQWVQQRLNP